MRCTFETGTVSGFPVIYVRGELDAGSCPDFESTLKELAGDPSTCHILDLLDVAYSEAAPLHSVLLAHREFFDQGKTLAVVCCAPFIERLTQIMGMDEHVELFRDVHSAAEYLARSCGSLE